MKTIHKSSNSCAHFSMFLIIYLLCRVYVDAVENDTDRLALLKFKASISGDPHGVLGSWNDSVHFCEWPGIRCTGLAQRAAVLDLSGHGLRGLISPHLGNLSSLEALDLFNNSFSGGIPPQLGRLSRLQHLGLGQNVLAGQIPLNLSRCSELRKLLLGPNGLTGAIPSELRSLEKLEVFDLESNNLTGGLPGFLGNTSSLREIYLSYNNLIGNVPVEIGRLKNLSVFSVGINNLYGTIPLSIYNMSSLTSLSITDNQFEGKIPSLIKLPNLIEFYIGGNGFSGTIPDSLSNSSQLLRVDVSDNDFVGQVPASFGKLPDIRWLVLNKNRLGSYSADHSLGFIESLTNCTKLKVLSLSANNFGGVLPSSIANLSTQMTHIYLGRNRLFGRIDHVMFENLPNLVVLSMGGNRFRGDIPASLGKLQSLQILVLDSNEFSGKIQSFIGNLTEVFGLSLQHNKLEGNIPSSIEGCRSLQLLDMSSNDLDGALPEEIFGIDSLISVNLSRNSLSGELPVEVGRLKHASEIDLSDNDLSGEIPGTIGNCESLEFLLLQGNLFRGELPSNLASLQGLQYLDLSRNNLSGKIPIDLENLSVLIYLNLSFNDFEGEVPNRSVFRNTTVLSIVGNAKLCGGVSELQLPKCPTQESDQRKKTKSLKLVIVSASLVSVFLLLSGLVLLHFKRKSRRKSSTDEEEEGIGFLSKVSYKTLHKATGGFSPSALIGSGSFGSVYKGTLDQSENPVAIKVLNLQQKGAGKSFVAECDALRNIRHRNLVKILTCCSSADYNGDEFKALVFEYMSNGSLEKWLHKNNRDENRSMGLSLIQRLNIAIDVALAIRYLHEECDRPIIHCDLKPSNVLLDEEMVARVSDFGLARLSTNTSSGFTQGQTSTTGLKGTIGYAAPEYAMGGEASKHGDVYSYGILLLEMFTGKRPTDEMFKDDFDLRNFVETALPERFMQVVDSALLSRDVEAEKWLVSVLGIGIACSGDSPSERPSIGDVTRELQRVRTACG